MESGCWTRAAACARGLLVAVVATLALAAPAIASASPPLKVTVRPNTVIAGSTAMYTFKAKAKNAVAGQLSLVVPAGWSAPQSSNSTVTGYVVINRTTCASAGPYPDSITGSGPWTVVLSFNCAAGTTFSVRYGGKVASSKVTAPAAGPYEFTAALDTGSGFQRLVSQPVVTVTPNLSSVHLVVSGLPASPTAGTPSTFTVTARDASNSVVTGYAGTVHFTSTDGAATLPVDYTFQPGDAGSHTFTAGATLQTAGSQTLTATDTSSASVTGSQTVTVGAAAATHLVVSGLPGTPSAGVAGSVTVSAKDAYGNVADGYRGTVHFTSTDTSPGVQLPPNYSFVAGDAGAHTFTSAVSLTTAGPQTVTATDTLSSPITGSQPVIVQPGGATHLVVLLPGSLTAGVSASVTVSAQDPFGNAATGYRGSVHFTSTDASPSVMLPSNYTFTAGDAGVHTFTNGVTLATAGLQTLTATDTATAAISGSQSVSVQPASATHLVVALPASLSAGVPASVTVSAKDAYGNTAAGYRGTIHFSSSDTGPSVALPVDYTFVAGDAGAHTFTNGVTLTTAGSQSVTATDTASAGISGSDTADVTAGSLSNLVVSPSSATAEAPITASPPNMNVVDTSPYPSTAAFSAEGFDAYGNDLGDETAAAAWSVTGGGSCTGALCSPGSIGPANVSATVGAASGGATLTGALGPLAYSCQGDYYDVDNDVADGCEVLQPYQFHTRDTAPIVGAFSCNDGNTGTFTELLPSDQRIHALPAVPGFDGSTGSAPLWFAVVATGGLTCVNDYSVTLTVSNALSPSCYGVELVTDQLTDSSPTNSQGKATLSGGAGSYSSGSTVYFEVTKTGSCANDDPSFTLQFHL
jgi:hypothetical protein